MIIIKTPEEIEKLKTGGPILARILREVGEMVTPGISTWMLEIAAREKIKAAGCIPAFLGYSPEDAPYPFPTALITSINSEIVHGIPSEKRILREGDIISLDLGLSYEGVFLDHAITVAVGKIGKKDAELIAVTEEALRAGIEAIVPGAHVGDIGNAIESYVQEYKLGVVEGLSGHGVGRKIHEDPYIPNYGKKGHGAKLLPGMVIAIEPMISRGSEDIVVMPDGYTIKTKDNSNAAHFEHTVLITETGHEILTIEK